MDYINLLLIFMIIIVHLFEIFKLKKIITICRCFCKKKRNSILIYLYLLFVFFSSNKLYLENKFNFWQWLFSCITNLILMVSAYKDYKISKKNITYITYVHYTFSLINFLFAIYMLYINYNYTIKYVIFFATIMTYIFIFKYHHKIYKQIFAFLELFGCYYTMVQFNID